MAATGTPVEETMTQELKSLLESIATTGPYFFNVREVYVAESVNYREPTVFPSIVIIPGRTESEDGRAHITERFKFFEVHYALGELPSGGLVTRTNSINRAVADVFRAIASDRKLNDTALYTEIRGWDLELPHEGDSGCWALIDLSVQYRHSNTDLTLSF